MDFATVLQLARSAEIPEPLPGTPPTARELRMSDRFGALEASARELASVLERPQELAAQDLARVTRAHATATAKLRRLEGKMRLAAVRYSIPEAAGRVILAAGKGVAMGTALGTPCGSMWHSDLPFLSAFFGSMEAHPGLWALGARGPYEAIRMYEMFQPLAPYLAKEWGGLKFFSQAWAMIRGALATYAAKAGEPAENLSELRPTPTLTHQAGRAVQYAWGSRVVNYDIYRVFRSLAGPTMFVSATIAAGGYMAEGWSVGESWGMFKNVFRNDPALEWFIYAYGASKVVQLYGGSFATAVTLKELFVGSGKTPPDHSGPPSAGDRQEAEGMTLLPLPKTAPAAPGVPPAPALRASVVSASPTLAQSWWHGARNLYAGGKMLATNPTSLPMMMTRARPYLMRAAAWTALMAARMPI